jgi:hypothetical protein
MNAPEELASTAHVLYKKGTKVEAAEGAVTLATLQSPYFNRTWRHFCSHLHAPPSGQDAGYPAAVRKGDCVYFAHPIFGQYQANAPRWCRTLVASALDLLLPERLVTAENAPTTLLTALSHQATENRHVLHLLHYIPERRGQAFDTIEDVIPLHDLTVSVKSEAPVRSATLEPGGAALSFTQEDGRVRVTVPKLEGHAMVVLAG